MFDIAISGPLAGLVLALPFAWFGLKSSTVLPADAQANVPYLFGDPLILQWMAKIIFPGYSEAQVLNISPMGFAGWVGIFITALNLIPIGQLDGGHILYMLIGRKAHRVAIAVLWISVVLMIITKNFSYMFLVLLLMVFGARHPPTSDDTVPLGWPRIVLGWLTLAFIFIGFTPTPIIELPNGPKPAAPSPKEKINPDDFVLRQIGIERFAKHSNPSEAESAFLYGREGDDSLG
jgi:membrane-associated protease RseP (regulator of RpoE activity)